MAITDGVATAYNYGTSVTINGCTAGRALIGIGIGRGGGITGCTCSGESPQAADSSEIIANSGTYDIHVRIYYIPSLASSGNKTMAFTFSGASDYLTIAKEIQGHDSANFLGNLIGVQNGTANGIGDFTGTGFTSGYAGSAGIILLASLGSGSGHVITGYTNDFNIGSSPGYRSLQKLLDLGSAGSKSIGGNINYSSGWWGLKGIEVRAAGGGSVDLAGGATAGASGSATLTAQRNLAAAAVAGALASGALSVNKALTGAAIGAALGSATLTAFSQVWRIPTSAPNGTAVHATVLNGSSPTYAILAQGTAIVAGGYVDLPTSGTPGTKALAFVHNYNDNTATTSIRGGPSIATLTSI